MKFTKTLVAAALLAGAASTAQAAAPGQNALILGVYDSTHAQVYDLNLEGLLGKTYSAMLTGGSFTVDLSTDATWNTFAGTNDANLASGAVYGIEASLGLSQFGFQYASASATPMAALSKGNVTSAASNIVAATGRMGLSVSATNSAIVTDANATSGGWIDAPGSANNYGNLWGGLTAANGAIAYGATGTFWNDTSNGLAGANAKQTQAALGTFNLSGNTLTYTSNAAAVPLPTAVWMFGAGLMAMLGVSRRKAAAV
jgi:hypothetical protein